MKKVQNLQIGDRIIYEGPTIEKPWLPRGTTGTIVDFEHGLMFPVICNFDIEDGDDWPMTESELEKMT